MRICTQRADLYPSLDGMSNPVTKKCESNSSLQYNGIPAADNVLRIPFYALTLDKALTARDLLRSALLDLITPALAALSRAEQNSR